MNLLLVHGLWRTPLSFLVLVRRLRGWGCSPEQFAYAAVAQPYETIVRRLADRLNHLARRGPYAVIGHSLGGVLLRAALPLADGPPPRRLIMLGTPNRPPKLARLLGSYWMYQKVMGECGVNLASDCFYAELPVPAIPYTIVAGTAGPRGRWSPFGEEPNDGIVAVSETRIRDNDAPEILPVTHTFMMNNAAVHRVIQHALGCEDSPA
ncbi:MAG TPA: alpha/beta fold hydrolase [Gemmatimonadales bacterium]|nr:alpha/beta fold hydrolase [Gemmatimonadales bacterium]